MKIVCVSACTTGIAHTYMVQAGLEEEGKKRGFDIKVETQGGMGVENELTDEEVAAADVVILAISIGIEGAERFDDKPTLTVDPSQAIKDPAGVIDQALALLD